VTTREQLKKQVSEVCLALHDRGWVANHDGNVSARLSAEPRFLISPTATSKRLCPPSSLVLVDLAGKAIGSGRPPSELSIHIAAYRARPDSGAVIHAHPPFASAFALARAPIEPIGMPEVVVSLGASVPLVPLLLPKDPRTDEAIAAALGQADAALLAGNGVLAIGLDLEQAYLRVELLEHYARILSIARGIGGAARLEPEEVSKLLEMRKAAGLGPSAPARASAAKEESLQSKLRPIVAEEVRRALGGRK
jgi:L-fuculose-phosphate aldolase